jgi:FkbM family methyltransferase
MADKLQRRSGGLTADQIAEYVGRPDPVVIEVGCNNGVDSIKFMDAMPRIRLFCFEPDPRPLVKFKKLTAMAKTLSDEIDLRVELYEMAVSDKDGTSLMWRSSGMPPRWPKQHDGDWDMSGSLLEPTGHLDYSKWVTFPESHRLEVKTIRLDTWLKQHPEIDQIDFLWIDAQGGEGDVILGGPKALAITRYMYCEIPFIAPGTKFHNLPLYAGQRTLAELQTMLPDWDAIALHDTDNVLFKRIQ